jgi:hypothetical protein
MRFAGVIVGVLVLAVSHLPPGLYSDESVITIAAATGKAGGQGVSGRPQKNGTVKGSPKPNSSINGSQFHGKH